MKKGPFVSLHNHTELGSPLDGMNDVYDLFVRAKEVDHPAVAITDHGSLTALYDGYKASQKTGVKLIPGGEFYFTTDVSTKKNSHLILLAKNEVGYRNLLRLNYESFKNQSSGYMGRKIPRLTWELLEDYNEGLFCLSACSSGLISKTMIQEKEEALAIEYMLKHKDIFGSRYLLEIQPHDLFVTRKDGSEVNQEKLNNKLIYYSKKLKIPYVITCDAHYRDREHAKYHDYMLAIKDKKAIEDPDRFRYSVQEMYLKTHEEIVDFFGKKVSTIGMSNSIKIMNACEEPHYLGSVGPILPTFKIEKDPNSKAFYMWNKDSKNKELSEDKAFLRFKCIEGFKIRTKGMPTKDKTVYWDRIKAELSVLEGKNFSSYMLIVYDMIRWAKSTGMPVGPGRGSASGSLVAYLLGITNVDPIKYGLIFERFQNSQKTSFPDIDTDFARPDLVKSYLMEHYGTDNISSIGTITSLTPKVTIKDVARSLRIGGSRAEAFQIANTVTSSMPDSKTIEEAMKLSPELSRCMREYPDLYTISKKLQGLTRNLGVHAAGVVISDKPLYEMIPLRIEANTGLVISLWEKTRIEEYGLIKFDVLGLNTLTIMDEAIKRIKWRHNIDIDLEDLPLDDQNVYKMIGDGNTACVFQLESSLTPLCVRLKPKSIEDISAINALGRPSCQPAVRELYIKRHLGEAKINYLHPNMERALKDTLGVLLYEESAMFVAQDCAGWDLNQADSLRKLSKLKGKDPAMAKRTEDNFIKDTMRVCNISRLKANRIWKEFIEPLSGYSFNKSHAISYSMISYQTAWLKYHYPVEFMCAMLNGQDSNSDKISEYIKACKDLGLTVTPPNLNSSEEGYSVIDDKRIACGLGAIKKVGSRAQEEIIKHRPYAGFTQFIVKTSGAVCHKGVIRNMAKAGVFTEFGESNKDIHDNYANFRAEVVKFLKKNEIAHRRKLVSELDITLEEAKDAPYPVEARNAGMDELNMERDPEEWSLAERLMGEKEVMGRTLSGSMYEVFKSYFSNDRSTTTLMKEVQGKEEGARVRIEVVIDCLKKEFKIKAGKNVGKKFAKYSVEDIDGNCGDLTVFSTDYAKYKDLLKDGTPLKAICSINEYMGQKSLVLKNVESIYGRRG